MRYQLLSAAAIIAATLTSCGGGASTDENPVADSTAVMSYTIDPAASKLDWAGTMVGIKTHRGTLNFLNGTFTTLGGKLTSGDFTVDMKNYTMNDTNYAKEGSEQGTKAHLMRHLMSGEFFAVDSFPTATLKITGVTGNTATADLTVRGKTNSETITDIVITPNPKDSTVTATASLNFDRQKYGVSWSSGSKDYVLNDIIELKVELSGKAR
ncbi:MAG TPA: YceI family protein [Flavobacteriales bacterium]|nr:YceI family protein [Flavobacteriales bacterium]